MAAFPHIACDVRPTSHFTGPKREYLAGFVDLLSISGSVRKAVLSDTLAGAARNVWNGFPLRSPSSLPSSYSDQGAWSSGSDEAPLVKTTSRYWLDGSSQLQLANTYVGDLAIPRTVTEQYLTQSSGFCYDEWDRGWSMMSISRRNIEWNGPGRCAFVCWGDVHTTQAQEASSTDHCHETVSLVCNGAAACGPQPPPGGQADAIGTCGQCARTHPALRSARYNLVHYPAG
ncbi:hypothetical protein CH063_15662, partial [Colletotrichum higginsianum]